jgi:hypothetical protein
MVFCVISAGATSFLSAQEVEGGAGNDAVDKKQAHVRAWLFPSRQKKEVVLIALQPEAEAPRPLASSDAGAVAASPSYRTAPEGEIALQLKSGDETLAEGRVALRGSRYYTVAAWEDGSKWTLKVFADGPPSPGSRERPVRIFNFAGNRETFVSIGQGSDAKVGRSSVQELKAPPMVTMVSVKVLAEDGGAPAQSSVEVDLSSLGSAYVVVGPDYRGRMRPRIITGGEIKEEAAPTESMVGGQM